MLSKIPSLAEIARSPYRSANPGMWPAHAWLPACGATGGTVYDIAGGNAHATMNGTWDWNPDMPGIRTTNTGGYNYGRLGSNVLTDLGDDFTFDAILYVGDALPASSTYMSMFAQDGTQNSLRLRFIYNGYYSRFYTYLSRDGWTDYNDYLYFNLGAPYSVAGDNYLGIHYLRVASKQGSTITTWLNGSRLAGSSTINASMDWSEVDCLFGRDDSTSESTCSTVLYMALHNKVIDEPLIDPFSWARQNRRRYYPVLTSSTSFLPAWALRRHQTIGGGVI